MKNIKKHNFVLEYTKYSYTKIRKYESVIYYFKKENNNIKKNTKYIIYNN